MTKTLVYLFDPLCGWCYGASGVLSSLLASVDITLTLMPTGLFADEGARAMNDAFAAYAWENDQRIAQMTGQVFSERYRSRVLADRSTALDSGPATVALTAVALSAPEREFEALHAIQAARYVDGLDVTSKDTLRDILTRLALDDAANRVTSPDAELEQATDERVTHGRALLRQVGARGVPTFLVDDDGRVRPLSSNDLFSNPRAFLRELTGAG